MEIIIVKNKHLTATERQKIEFMLKQGCSLKEIAHTLDKNLSTISREIRKRAVVSEKFAVHYPANYRFSRQLSPELPSTV